jgi:hypothetical protein
MRKRDSIEFLWDELKPFLPANYTVDESVKILSILEQAKAMHKEEIENAYDDGWHHNNEDKYNPIKYYRETYESNS